MLPPPPQAPWGEIRARADRFSRRWQDRLEKERQDFLEVANTQPFYDEFFEIFGKDRGSVARYEENVRLARDNRNPKRIDVLWPGKLLIEQKRPGRNLLDALNQAMEYNENLPSDKRAHRILVSDFRNFELHNEEGLVKRFSLSNLPQHVESFGFMLNFNMGPILQSKSICDKDGTHMAGPILRRIRRNARWLLLVSWTVGLVCGMNLPTVTGQAPVTEQQQSWP